jgi:hypothetical protein
MTVPSSRRLCHFASAHIAAARRRGKWNNTDSIIVDRLYGRFALGDMHIVEDEVAHHVRRYQAGELPRKVEAAGFSPVCSTSFMTLLLPMLLAARFGPRKHAQELGAEFAIPRWLNRLLAATAPLDYIIKGGLDLPCGGSRLLVARKA